MSSSDHGPGHASAAHHDDPHDAFDPEPVQELAADETPSPGWLPVVGGGALLIAATWFFYPGAGAARPASVEATLPPAVSAAAPAARATGAARKAAVPKPTGSGSPITRRMVDVKAGDKKKAPPPPRPQPRP